MAIFWPWKKFLLIFDEKYDFYMTRKMFFTSSIGTYPRRRKVGKTEILINFLISQLFGMANFFEEIFNFFTCGQVKN